MSWRRFGWRWAGVGLSCMSGSPAPAARPTRWEGWQLGLLAVGMALLAAWLALPRPVPPAELPLPLVDQREVTHLREREAGHVAEAEQKGLSFDARAVGELLRRHGAAVFEGDAHRALRAQQDVRSRARELLRRGGARELSQLRAVQTQLFAAALARFERTGKRDAELQELSGNFEAKARAVGWLAGSRLALSEQQLFVLYRVRWTELVGVREEPLLRLTLWDYRVYYRILLLYPEGRSELERDSARLSYVEALARRDGDYPQLLARGVLLYRMGQPASAAAALLQHLEAHPDGLWALRARNYALAALAELQTEE